MFRPISRRTALKGLGVAIALPLLDAMRPVFSFAAPEAKPLPKRLGIVYIPNGATMAEWTPKEEGSVFTLPSILDVLKPHQKSLLVLTGLTCDKARDHGDGPGDHARAMAAFLTGAHPRKTDGANIRTGISLDQLVAKKIGEGTRLPSLEIGTEGGRQAGNCDQGYSCAYSTNLSWASETMPMAKEIDPKLVFERMFGAGDTESEAARQQRGRRRQSILDYARDEAKSLNSSLGANDQHKLDEYLTAVREVERRIQRAAADPAKPPTSYSPPTGIPTEFVDHLRLLSDLMVLAYQSDLTRVVTFSYGNERSNRGYRNIDVPEGHHDLSHHGNEQAKIDKITKINRFHAAQFAYLLDRLQSIHEGDGTLLDNCMLLYGGGHSDGNRHAHDNLPIVVAGTCGGALKTGRHLVYPNETPVTNLYVSMLQRLGIQMDSFGDSTGKLANL